MQRVPRQLALGSRPKPTLGPRLAERGRVGREPYLGLRLRGRERPAPAPAARGRRAPGLEEGGRPAPAQVVAGPRPVTSRTPGPRGPAAAATAPLSRDAPGKAAPFSPVPAVTANRGPPAGAPASAGRSFLPRVREAAVTGRQSRRPGWRLGPGICPAKFLGGRLIPGASLDSDFCSEHWPRKMDGAR